MNAHSPAPLAFDRVGFASGILASLIYVVGTALFIFVIVPDLPAIRAPAPERAAFYAEMSRNTLYRSLSYLGQMQMPLLLLFFGALFGVLRRAEGETGGLSVAVLGAGIALSIISPITMLIEDHLMLGFAAVKVDPVIVAAIDGLVPLSFAQSGFPQAIVLGGTAALILRQGVAPRWIGWLGVVLAVISVVGTGTLMRGAMFPVSSLATLLFRLWLLALCVALYRRAGVANMGSDSNFIASTQVRWKDEIRV